MKFLFVFIAIFSLTVVNGQEQPHLKPETAEWFLRFSPLSLIDPFDVNLTVGLEHVLTSRLSVTTDMSFVFYSSYIENNNGTAGYIVKPAVRYYLSDQRSVYLETTFFYKDVSYKMEDWLGKDAVNGVPAYDQFQRFVYRKQVLGVNLQAGWNTWIGRSKKFRFEVFAGVGARFRWLQIKNEPRASYNRAGWFSSAADRPFLANPNLAHGIRLVYALR